VATRSGIDEGSIKVSKSDGTTLGRKVCALALPAFPLALLAGTLISPTDSTKNATQLRAAAAHGSAWQAAALLELLAALLFPFAIAGVIRAVRGRGARLAGIGAVFGVLGTLGIAAIGFRHLFIYGLATTDSATALHVLDRTDKGAGAVALPLLFAGPIALILLAGATARARLAPRWVTFGAIAFFISDMLPIPAAEELQGLIGIATFATIAHRILRHADGSAETIAPATGSTVGARLEPSATKAGV
jgi:hypothetical protein